MIIKVSKDDIKYGDKDNSRNCPVALAIKRQTKYINVVVGCRLIGVGFPTKWKKVSPRTRKFVLDFDTGKPVKPFKFTFE